MEELKKDVLFSNVYGYEDIKKELLLIKSWLTNEEFLSNPIISLPKAVLFYGPPGCGKTLLLREFSNSFDCPKFIIEGSKDNVADEISSIFKKAKDEKFALVLIDEIDLLINKNSLNTRILQQELDGIDNRGHIFVLATSNHYEEIPSALLRDGRFDRRIFVGYPDYKAREIMFTKFLKEFGFDIENISVSHIAKVCSRVTCASIKSICNDLFLRLPHQEISDEDVGRSYIRIIDGEFCTSPDEYKNFRVAVHECSHALMALHFSNNWNFYSASFKEYGGETIANQIEERDDTIEKRIQSIMISLAGYLGEEVIFGAHDVGSYSDYQKAHNGVTRLVERVCHKGINHLIPIYESNADRYESPQKRLRNEKLVTRLLAKYVRKVKSYLKKHKADLHLMADYMFKNGRLTYKNIQALNIKA